MLIKYQLQIMKKLLKLMIFSLFLSLVLTSCEDKNDDPQSEDQKQMQDILNELDKISDIGDFTTTLKNMSGSINAGNDKITVFAIRNKINQKSTSPHNPYTLGEVKRHIVKGGQDLLNMSGDTVIMKSIADDVLYATKYEGQVYINGIPLVSSNPTRVGDNYIYVVSDVVPEEKDMPKYSVLFSVRECNENWSVEKPESDYPSEETLIFLYQKQNSDYILVDSVWTNKNGKAMYKHNYNNNLYYKVIHPSKKQTLNGYLVKGIFTSEEEIELYPEYRTHTSMDNIGLGSVKLADINYDGYIDEEDKVSSEYFNIDNTVKEETIYISSEIIFFDDAFYKPETIILMNKSLEERFNQYLSINYTINNRLILPSVNYPSLNNLNETNYMWQYGYSYVKNFYTIIEKISQPTFPSYLKKEWDTALVPRWNELAYIYSTLVSYFGGVPLVDRVLDIDNPKDRDIVRSSKEEIMQFVEAIAQNLAADESAAIDVLLARYFANENNYLKAYTYAKKVIDGGKYSLVTDNKPFATASNNEVILGGYNPVMNLAKGNFTHPVRYREALLTCAESAVELNKVDEAIQYIDQIYRINNKSGYSGERNKDSVRAAIHTLWSEEMNKEGFDYMLLNRWGTLLDVLGQYGALSYNNLLPIPPQEMYANEKLIQNPGY